MEYESYSLCVLPADIAGLISGRHMDFSVHDIFLILPAEGVCWQHAHYLTLKDAVSSNAHQYQLMYHDPIFLSVVTNLK